MPEISRKMEDVEREININPNGNPNGNPNAHQVHNTHLISRQRFTKMAMYTLITVFFVISIVITCSFLGTGYAHKMEEVHLFPANCTQINYTSVSATVPGYLKLFINGEPEPRETLVFDGYSFFEIHTMRTCYLNACGNPYTSYQKQGLVYVSCYSTKKYGMNPIYKNPDPSTPMITAGLIFLPFSALGIGIAIWCMRS